jgi:hypothetical protein
MAAAEVCGLPEGDVVAFVTLLPHKINDTTLYRQRWKVASFIVAP